MVCKDGWTERHEDEMVIFFLILNPNKNHVRPRERNPTTKVLRYGRPKSPLAAFCIVVEVYGLFARPAAAPPHKLIIGTKIKVNKKKKEHLRAAAAAQTRHEQQELV
ncbi:hypothetical protein QOT17_002112 [Balamuthia mandrillaris]